MATDRDRAGWQLMAPYWVVITAFVLGSTVVSLSGCADLKPTAIAVAIVTDFSLPQELDTLSITVSQGDIHKGNLLYSLDTNTPGHIALPGTLILNASDNVSDDVSIEISGTLASTLVIRRQAALKFVKGRVILLTLELLKFCSEPTACTASQTCSATGCIPIEVDSNSLPDYVDGTVPQITRDAGVPPDGSLDADGPSADSEPDGPSDGALTDGLDVCVHPVVKKDCTDGWCTIPAGCFTMGSPVEEMCRSDKEIPHSVTLTHSFEIQEKETTQKDYLGLMGANPSTEEDKACGPNCPVTELSSSDAMEYCNALSTAATLDTCYTCNTGASCEVTEKYGQWGQLTIYDCPGYRLPTEAEWEYAYRAGTTTAYYFGTINNCFTEKTIDAHGWYRMNTSTLKETGLFPPNPWGLYDMSGNTDERVHDLYPSDYVTTSTTDPVGSFSGTNRRARGGYYDSSPVSLRAANRGAGIYPGGVRCVRSLPGQ